MKTITSIPGVILLIATAVNGYLGATIVQVAWNRAHGRLEAQADFGIAMSIAAASLPISAICIVAFVAWAVFRFAAPALIGYAVDRWLLTLAVLNIAAPLLLWYGLLWVVH